MPANTNAPTPSLPPSLDSSPSNLLALSGPHVSDENRAEETAPSTKLCSKATGTPCNRAEMVTVLDDVSPLHSTLFHLVSPAEGM